jgi:hypothetical protein
MKTCKVFTWLGDFHTLKAARSYIWVEFGMHRICGRHGKPHAQITYWRHRRRPSRFDRVYLDGHLKPPGGEFRVHGVVEVMKQ